MSGTAISSAAREKEMEEDKPLTMPRVTPLFREPEFPCLFPTRMVGLDLETIASRIGTLPQPNGDAPQAAVAAILRPGGAHGPEILFIERAEREGDPWSGHMAFPGGRRDPVDGTLVETAIRETKEEVGLDLARHTFLGTLADVPTHRTGLVVRAFVFMLTDATHDVERRQEEVADVVWAPIGPLLRGEMASTFEFVPDGFDVAVTLPSFKVGERVVWGLTYRMLELLFEAIR
jgi:8-oxo-dGTP pyrophosphatase MutT (NUDIX family)